MRARLQASVVVVLGRAMNQSLLLAGRTAFIGRSADADLVTPDEGVSRIHASIGEEQGRFVVRDLASKNGTFVNDERVVGARVLQPGDEIRLGVITRLVFHLDAEPLSATG